MTTGLARRLGKLEAAARDEQLRGVRSAMSRLVEGLTPEHRQPLRDWIVRVRAQCAVCTAGHDDTQACLGCLGAVESPSLVSAICILVADHINRGAPIVLPPETAWVYVDRADAVSAMACPDCGYLLPSRRGRLAFSGPCPGCDAAVAAQGR